MYLLKKSYIIVYRPFIKEIQNVSYVSRYEYPTSQAVTFGLLIRRYGKIQVISGQGGWVCVNQGRIGDEGMSNMIFTKQVQKNLELVPGRYSTTMQ